MINPTMNLQRSPFDSILDILVLQQRLHLLGDIQFSQEFLGPARIVHLLLILLVELANTSQPSPKMTRQRSLKDAIDTSAIVMSADDDMTDL